MHKKYIIEKRDLALLPSSYIGLGNKFSIDKLGANLQTKYIIDYGK